jgi:hypothetical protein
MPRLVEARYVRDFVIWIRFNDGIEGEVDLAGKLHPRDRAKRRVAPAASQARHSC